MGAFPAQAGQRLTSQLINHMYAISDTVVTTVTAASLASLSNVYTIPASDAAVGCAYRLTSYGNGTWGSTAQTLEFASVLAGTAISTPTLGSSVLSTSQIFRWRASILLIPITVGSSATWECELSGVVTEFGNNILPTSGTQNSVPFTSCNTSAVTQDSTVANTLAIQAAWGSATGSPTLTCRGTCFERLG